MVRWAFGIALIAAAAAAALLPVPPGWVEQHYARGLFPPLQRALTPVSNVAPFALLDALIVAGIALVCVALATVTAAPRGGRLRVVARRCWQGLVVTALAYLVFLMCWGFNYRRMPLVSDLDFDEKRVTAASVAALNERAIREIGLLRPRLPERMDAWPDRKQLTDSVGRTLNEGTSLLGLPGPVRPGRPKRSLLDVYLTRAGVSGMTDPIFLETLVASNVLPFEYPAVLAHEWGHLAGLARESDASFFGLMVCLHGDDAARYSAWLEIFLHTLGARPLDERRAAAARLPAFARADLQAMAARSARDEVRAISLVAWRTYDTYLRSQRVGSGIRNYGEVVRLLAGTRYLPEWRPVLRQRR